MRRALLTLLATLAATGPLQAQAVLRGTIHDSDGDAVIASAQVTLSTWDGRRMARMVASTGGVFSFPGLRPGHYRLTVARQGYLETTTPPVRVRDLDTIAVEVRLATDAVLLAPVTVVSRSRLRTNPVLGDFYHRVENGFGRYITRDQIERRNPHMITDVLTMVPGVRTVPHRSGFGAEVVISRALIREGGCPVQIFVDGQRFNRRAASAARDAPDSAMATQLGDDYGVPIDAIVTPADVEGIEVYSGIAGVPAEFIGPDARCGTVAIWTRRRN